MKIKSQAGFSLIESLLVIIAITLVVFVGFYVYNAKNDANKTLDKAATSTNARSQKAKKSKNYLFIKELGIKLKLDQDLQGLEYKYSPEASDGVGSKNAGLSEKRFTKTVKACNAEIIAGDPVNFANISRYEGTYDPQAQPHDVFAEFVKQLPGFYLEYGNPDGGFCRGTDQVAAKATEKLFKELNTGLKEAAKNAESIQ